MYRALLHPSGKQRSTRVGYPYYSTPTEIHLGHELGRSMIGMKEIEIQVHWCECGRWCGYDVSRG